MKKLGLIFDKGSKKVFLLPKEVKKLTEKQVIVLALSGLGKQLGIDDSKYIEAGAKIVKNLKELALEADVICKVNAFTQHELTILANKICITFANYLANVDMIYGMLKNKNIGYSWSLLGKDGAYTFFDKLETIKGKHAALQLEYGFSQTGATIGGDVLGLSHPKALIIYATYAGIAAAEALLASGIDVTMLDNDLEYCKETKNSPRIKQLCSIFNTKFEYGEAKFDNIMELIKSHNGLIYTCVDPSEISKTKITADMAKSMPKGSVLVDASCENGNGFFFKKDFAKQNINFDKLDNVVYSCIKDITEIYPMATSEIISSLSINDLLKILDDKNDEGIKNILIVKDGKVVNSQVSKELHLN